MLWVTFLRANPARPGILCVLVWLVLSTMVNSVFIVGCRFLDQGYWPDTEGGPLAGHCGKTLDTGEMFGSGHSVVLVYVIQCSPCRCLLFYCSACRWTGQALREALHVYSNI